MSVITPEMKKNFDGIVARYPNRQAAVIPLLHLVQKQEGRLSPEAQAELAAYLQMPPSKVEEVVSFYTMLSETKRGRHHLMLCRTLSCALKGCPDLVETVRQELGIRPGETTADGRFSLELSECLGACDLGCVMQVGDRIYGNLTPDKLKEVLKELAK